MSELPNPPAGAPSPVGTSEAPATSAPVASARPLTLDDTAALVGEYRWIEAALYRLLGEWVGDMPIAAVQVHLDAQSMRHAWHAELWSDRLPVLAGADPDGWTPRRHRPPPCSPPCRVTRPRPTGPGRPGRRRGGRLRRTGGPAPAGRSLPGGAPPAGHHLRAALGW